MKELFTKSFWEDVKKTFHEALEGPPPAGQVVQTPTDGASETPSSPSGSSERP